MVKSIASKKPKSVQPQEGITRISVGGYKSINQEQSIEVRPMTILAGANSSGKSSIMQPLLLMKQTLEANYDPGPLLLDGPNVRFTSIDQMFSSLSKGSYKDVFSVTIEVGNDDVLIIYFYKQPDASFQIFQIKEMSYIHNGVKTIFRPEMSHDKIASTISPELEELAKTFFGRTTTTIIEWTVTRDRFFLQPAFKPIGERTNFPIVRFASPTTTLFETYIRGIIHVPGLRGNPERTYSVSAVGSQFRGTFENYHASVIAWWQTQEGGEDKLQGLSKDLERLGLTWKVAAQSIDDTQVELQVGRLPRTSKNGASDLVSIADVGFGVSQTLPVLVALHAAEPGQLVYLEQPEIHLHPRAQTAMAEVLADAAKRGVRMVVETHSSLLLLGVQTLVAEGKLSPDLVKLHWFERRADGSTEITSANLSESGAFGDWPEDFADVSLDAERRFLDAAVARKLVS